MAATAAGLIAQERALLEGARGGDGHAFGGLVGLYRSELHAHCYRMLGSVHDADDALQDTLLRAWRGLPGFDGRRPVRPWLYKIATNACLDVIATGPGAGSRPTTGPRPARAAMRRHGRWPSRRGSSPIPISGSGSLAGMPRPRRATNNARRSGWPSSPRCSICPRGSARSSSSATCSAFRPGEVAAALDTTPASVNSALQRARETAKTRLPGQSQQSAMRSLGDKRLRSLVQRVTDALETGRARPSNGKDLLPFTAEDHKQAQPSPSFISARCHG
jgi:RNA polymerase sigma-70 factor (ECF subfamily)